MSSMTPTSVPRVLLVDDEERMRRSLRYLLEVEDVAVVGEAADAGAFAYLRKGCSSDDLIGAILAAYRASRKPRPAARHRT
jgi:FixJ family two-component response regulator